MRWDELRVEEQESRQLPGYKEPAAVRTFDAPEAMDIRFYEVHAKSALNRVPKQSQVPFKWTVNPYRGCTHACVYCLGGETPILLANGRTRPLADVRVGDEIYGTRREGTYRRYTPTKVLAHWSTVKPAYRITLHDGTELVASEDHRFLTNRGWKYVTGTEQGIGRRPHLTSNVKLMGPGHFALGPDDSEDYRRGYLCGLIRGDGHIGSYSYERPGRQIDDHHRFRLALADLEPLQRARRYLADFAVSTDGFAFGTGYMGARPMTAIRTSARARVAAIQDLVRWPRSPDAAWCKGFLAGIFDAEGSCPAGGALRVGNCDEEIIEWSAYCLRRLDFSYVIERTGKANGMSYVRVPGGLTTQLRFFHTADPAITRKRNIDGLAVKCKAPLGVASVEPLGVDLPMFDITTGTGDFIANGVVSHNCFARPTHTYLDLNAGRDFEREIVVKVNAPELLRRELRKPSWKREHIALGTNTDPYQWVESRYKLMPGIWEAIRDSGTSASVLTKSPLLLRDIELMKEIHARSGFTASVSVPTLDEKVWRETEPHTPHPRARLEAIGELHRAGLPTGVLIAPLMPGVNDAPEQVGPILELAAEMGADDVIGIALHLRREVKDLFFAWLREHRPHLIPRYEDLYARGAYAPSEEKKRLARLVKPANPRRARRYVQDPPPEPEAPPSAPAPEQPTLF
jgi:DNA repair photolyase